ncbi:winged helix-turn-helix domain-containing protein [Ancylobacter terrae]|uniref:winged helix-turn-helix domain-containing protein n=1 Tax=Ancylobacter sp. sgz301288 TaxID=3342077 RepID=UPI00385D38A1
MPDHPAPSPAALPQARIFIRIDFGDGRRLGPGKIALLEAIRTERSILSAARSLGMSYRRAWLLVDELDHMFEERVVATFPGRRGHGTELTAFGERLIALYRAIERQGSRAAKAATAELTACLARDWSARRAEAPASETA